MQLNPQYDICAEEMELSVMLAECQLILSSLLLKSVLSSDTLVAVQTDCILEALKIHASY